MPDGPEVGIQFITSSDSKGAKDVADAISQVKKAVQESSPEQAKLNQEETRSQDVKKKLAQETQNLKREKTGLIAVVRSLTSEIPFLHTVVEALRHPITLVSSAVGLLYAGFRAWAAAIDELAGRLRAFESGGKPFTTFASDAISRIKTLRTEIEEAKKETTSYAVALAKVNEQLGIMARLREEKTSVVEASELEKIKSAQMGGTITDSEALKQEAAVKQRFERDRQAEQMEQLDRVFRATGYEQLKQEQDRARLEAGLPGASDKTKMAETKADEDVKYAAKIKKFNDGQRTILDKQIEEQEDQVANAQIRIGGGGAAGAVYRLLDKIITPNADRGKQLTDAESKLRELQAQRSAMDKEDFAVDAEANASKVLAGEAKEAEGRISKQLIDVNKNLEDIKRRLESNRFERGEIQKHLTEIQPMQAATRASETQRRLGISGASEVAQTEAHRYFEAYQAVQDAKTPAEKTAAEGRLDQLVRGGNLKGAAVKGAPQYRRNQGPQGKADINVNPESLEAATAARDAKRTLDERDRTLVTVANQLAEAIARGPQGVVEAFARALRRINEVEKKLDALESQGRNGRQ